jgi:plastocyanin
MRSLFLSLAIGVLSFAAWGGTPPTAQAQRHDGGSHYSHPSSSYHGGYSHPYAYHSYYRPYAYGSYYRPYGYDRYYRPYRYYSYYRPFWWYGYPYNYSSYYPYYNYYSPYYSYDYPYDYSNNYSYPSSETYVPPTTEYAPTYGAQDTEAWRVAINDNYFEPRTLEVPVGATVTWTNYGGNAHTVTSYRGLFDSGELKYGATFSRTFSEPGSYHYNCKLHPNEMGGAIIVR